jgi:hypothetical protein
LFKALGKIEAEHASIWRKILKLPSVPPGSETCHMENVENLKESHEREDISRHDPILFLLTSCKVTCLRTGNPAF